MTLAKLNHQISDYQLMLFLKKNPICIFESIFTYNNSIAPNIVTKYFLFLLKKELKVSKQLISGPVIKLSLNNSLELYSYFNLKSSSPFLIKFNFFLLYFKNLDILNFFNITYLLKNVLYLLKYRILFLLKFISRKLFKN